MLKDITKEDAALVTLSGEVFSVLPAPAPRLKRVAPPKLLVPARVKRTNPEAKPTAYQVLKGARDIIADPKRWTRGAMARNKQGSTVCCHSASAVQFCAMGAILKTARNLTGDRSSPIVTEVLLQLGGCRSLTRLNDNNGREAVLSHFNLQLEKTDAA